ncbi:hypothetical protein TrispH2_001767 [Trichoplax sp. H2]|nr:hypothetical protein TrispH2_001767 [Trichoplax sp. H2]|eukprot:RDD46103.1 hypothetical protein TrispH2_001767 [Trichoplax sp. H2]
MWIIQNRKILSEESHCAKVRCLNLRGKSCSHSSIPLYIGALNFYSLINPAQLKVKCDQVQTIVQKANTEAVFESYDFYDASFGCAIKDAATTNWRIGGRY